MARIRSIKPEYWDDRKLAKRTSRDARLLYIALWNLADERGRLNGDPVWIKGQVFSYDDDLDVPAVTKLLDELAACDVGAVVPYEVDGDPYLYLPKLAKHQRLDRTVPSRLPEPPVLGADQSVPRTDEIVPRTGESVPGADGNVPSYVAGGRGQVAGGRYAREPASISGTALLDEHLACFKHKPPRDVIRKTGEQIDNLLDEPEISIDDIRAGLARLRAKPNLGPGVLPNLVNEVIQARDGPPGHVNGHAVDRRQQATDDLFEQAAARMTGRNPDGTAGNADPDQIRQGGLPAAAHGSLHPRRVA
jgi:hypothetical protein